MNTLANLVNPASPMSLVTWLGCVYGFLMVARMVCERYLSDK